jgi:hypothetical protein
MRWPFAMRSTVDAKDAEIVAEVIRRDAAESRACHWHDRLITVERRLVEITDLDRTTPEVMASVFAEWDSKQQAEFFNRFADISREWEMPRCFQFHQMMPDVSFEGRYMLEEIGKYAADAPAIPPIEVVDAAREVS